MNDDHRQCWAEWVWSHPRIAPSTSRGRALLISYIFPPVGGSAVQRPAKLAKYLPRYGWDIEVLTAGHERFPWRDESLLTDVPEGCLVHCVAGHEPACVARAAARLVPHAGWSRRVQEGLHWRLSTLLQRVGIEDPQSLWVGPATRFAARRHRKDPYDAIISSGPPHFVHRVALRMARRKGVPWIADIRDPLVSDFDRSPAAQHKIGSMLRLEKQIMRHAAIVVTTCPSLAEEFRQHYPYRPQGSIRCVTNGFDRDDLASAVEAASNDTNECVFVAAGAFYGRREVGRIVAPLQRVFDAHPEWRGSVRLVLAGTLDGEQQRRWQQDRPPWLTLAGYLDHASALRLTANSACAIVVVPQCRHGETSIPGKTFELLALPVHVLALVPPKGDTARIVGGAGASTITAFEGEAGIAGAMERIIAEHFAGRLENRRDWATLDRYDRACVAADFAACLGIAAGTRASATARRTPASDNATPSSTKTDNLAVPAGIEPASSPNALPLNVSI